jgi:hypothetical protein
MDTWLFIQIASGNCGTESDTSNNSFPIIPLDRKIDSQAFTEKAELTVPQPSLRNPPAIGE